MLNSFVSRICTFIATICEAHHLHNRRISKGLSHNYEQCKQFHNKPGMLLFIEDMKHTEPLAQPDTFLTVVTPLLLFAFLIRKRIIQTFHLLTEPFVNSVLWSV